MASVAEPAEGLPPGFCIVQVIPEFSLSGGAEAVTFELQRCWETAGVPSTVLAATIGPDVEPRQASRVELVLPTALADRVPTRGRWRYIGRTALVPLFTLAASARLRRARRHASPGRDAVILSHGDSLIADVIVLHAVNAANLAQKRQDGEWRWRLNPLHLWVELRDKRMLRGLQAHRYVAVSQRVVGELATFHGIPADRITVIPNGTDLERFTPDGERAGLRAQFAIPEDAPLLLFVGHEFDRKGLSHLIGALSQPGCGTAHVVAVGAGDVAAYAALAAAAGVAARVHFTGPRRDLPAIYRDADAFVFPTAYETFSLVCMEAMACGLPVFATRVGGIEDYLVDGVNGFAIDRDPATIAAALSPVLQDPALAARLRDGARSTALGYSWPVVAKRYLDLLLTVWDEKQTAPRNRRTY